MLPEPVTHFRFSVAIIGPSGVGKSAFLSAHSVTNGLTMPVSAQSLSTSRVTVGIQTSVETYQVEDKTYTVEYWDTPGADRYADMVTTLCGGGAACFFVYDVCSFYSFDAVEALIDKYETVSTAGGSRPRPSILIGHKADANRRDREVPSTEGEALAKRKRIPFFETTIEDPSSIAAAFEALLDAVAAQVAASKQMPSFEDTGILPATAVPGEGFFRDEDLTAQIDWVE